jgi:uncharacterized membrane protein YuzA (DUF378 family)
MNTPLVAIMVILLAVGAINWLLVAFKFNLVTKISLGSKAVETAIYLAVGIAALLFAAVLMGKKGKVLTSGYRTSLGKTIKQEKLARALAVPVIVLVIIGCLVWGVIGAANYNVVEKLLGVGAGTKVIYVAVGIAGILFLLGYGGLVTTMSRKR